MTDDSKGKCVGSTSAVLNSGYWYDINCEETYGYTCERLRDGFSTQSPNPPSKTNPTNIGCATGWIGYGSYCFMVSLMSVVCKSVWHRVQKTGKLCSLKKFGYTQDNAMLFRSNIVVHFLSTCDCLTLEYTVPLM